MRTFSICALALMGCSLTSKLNLPSLTTSSSTESTPRAARTSPTPTYASAGNGPLATPVVQAGPAPASYSWCSKVKSAGDNHLDRALTDDDPDRAIPAIAQFLCQPEGDAKAKRNELEARRQYWIQRMAMTEADWAADVPAWAAVPYSTRNTATVSSEEGLTLSKLSPVQQFALLADEADSYAADALELSQAGRVAFVGKCIHTNWDNEVHPAQWANCQPDIDALDGTKFGAELRGDAKATSYDRMVTRIAWANLAPKLGEHAAKVKKLLAADEIYGKLFDIARASHKDWPAIAASREPVLSMLRRLDDVRATGSRKGLPGCGEQAWSLFAAAIGNLPAKEFAGILESKASLNRPLEGIVAPILNNPDAYRAAAAYVGCSKDGDSVAKVLSAGLANWPGYRGPRTTAASKMFIANLQPDRGDAISYAQPGVSLSSHGDFTHDGTGEGAGVVESVSTAGDRVKVTFVKDMQTRDVCVQWRKTNRISRILPNGTVWYVDECVKREPQQSNYAPGSATVHKRFAAGITKGATLVVTNGIVVASYPKLGASPTVVLGVPVK